MRFFANLGIRAKIWMLTFVFSSIFSVVILLSACFILGARERQATLETRLLPRTEHVDTLLRLTGSLEIQLLFHLASTSGREMGEIAETMRKEEEEAATQLVELEKHSDPESATKLRAIFESLKSQRKTVIELSAAEEKQKAMVTHDDKLKPAHLQFLQELTNLNRAARAASQEASQGILQGMYNSLFSLVLGFVLALALGLFLSAYTIKSIVKPLSQVVALAKSGDLSLRLEARGSDELAQLCRSFDSLREHLRTKSKEAEAIAAGDLTRSINISGDRDILGKSFFHMNASLVNIVRNIRNSTLQIQSHSHEMEDASRRSSEGAQEQASAITQMLASLGIIKENAIENDKAFMASLGAARLTLDAAKSAQKKMEENAQSIKEVASLTERISKLMKSIDNIAFQTNLLALNASVEAAHAGKAGKGFAVVADEVRSLAARSAQSAHESADLILQTTAAVDAGVASSSQSAAGVSEMSRLIHAIVSDLESHQRASQQEVSRIEEVFAGISQIEQVTCANASSSEQAAQIAEELKTNAFAMKATLDSFQIPTHHMENS